MARQPLCKKTNKQKKTIYGIKTNLPTVSLRGLVYVFQLHMLHLPPGPATQTLFSGLAFSDLCALIWEAPFLS